jgi:hypothetical protein
MIHGAVAVGDSKLGRPAQKVRWPTSPAWDKHQQEKEVGVTSACGGAGEAVGVETETTQVFFLSRIPALSLFSSSPSPWSDTGVTLAGVAAMDGIDAELARAQDASALLALPRQLFSLRRVRKLSCSNLPVILYAP